MIDPVRGNGDDDVIAFPCCPDIVLEAVCDEIVIVLLATIIDVGS